MKSISVAVVTVFFCAVAVYATSEDVELDIDKQIQILSKAIECIVNVLGPLAEEHKELDETYVEYKKNSEKHVSDLKVCAEIGNRDKKLECAKIVVMEFMATVQYFDGQIANVDKEVRGVIMNSIQNECKLNPFGNKSL